VYFSAVIVGVPVGALLQGIVATAVGLRIVVIGSGLLLLAYALYAITRYDRFRMFDEVGAEELVHEVTDARTARR
jgi:Na+-transporting methylmalonyl-CoA/oxaloacetate decarboxylase gamma subunit